MTRVLVDTSIWIDHLRAGDVELADLLESNLVVTHPMVVTELALGSMRDRATVLSLLSALPFVHEATHAEVAQAIERQSLHGSGRGLVDAHLLVSALVTPGVQLWTRDRRLADAARAASVGRG